MKPRWLLAVFCIGVLTASSQTAAFPSEHEHMIVARGLPKSTVASVDEHTTDEPLVPIKITEMHVRSEIALRYARTTVTTTVHNPAKRAQEITFRMLLPETAFISAFTMILDGKSYKAYVKEKEEAKQIFTQAVSQGIGAAHVASKARDSNHFTVSVNVEGNTTGIFELNYEEFLVRRNGLYNHAINLHPGAFVPKMEVVVHIKESQNIVKLRVPELRTGNEVDATEKDAQNSKAVIKKGNSEKEVTVTFTPDLAEQRRLATVYADKTTEKSSSDKYIGYSSTEDEEPQDGTVLGQFVVQYDVERTNNGEILVNDGFFVHFLAPASLPSLSKYVVFVLDTSGSMMGRKIDQLISAMQAILSDLNPNDYFSIVEFNSNVKIHELKEADEEPPPRYSYYSFSENYNKAVKLVPPTIASLENIAKAKVIVSRLIASGGTNIYSALDVALNLVKKGVNSKNETDLTSENTETKDDAPKTEVATKKEDELEPVIIFLTDGDPTVGETSTSRIMSFATEKNSGENRCPLYTLAFGEDADRTFLRKLSLRNEGFMRHIYEAADAALQLHDFYRQVSSPLLSHVQFLYPKNQVKEGTVSRSKFRTVNAGSEVAVVGQITEDTKEITPQVLGFCGNDDGVGKKRYEISPKVPVNSKKDEYLPLERLWAYLTIKQLLDKRDAGEDESTDEKSFEKKALDIALKYAFVTPLTSLVVVKPNETKPVDVESVDNDKNKGEYDSLSAYQPISAPHAPSQGHFGSFPYASSAFSAVPGLYSFGSGNIQPLALDAQYEDVRFEDDETEDYSHNLRTVALFSSGSRYHTYSSGSGLHGPPGDDDPSSFLDFGGSSGSGSSYGLPGPPDRYSLNRHSLSGHPGLSSWGSSGLHALPDLYPYVSGYTTRPPQYLTTPVSTSSSPLEGYYLEDFEWTSSILEKSSDSLVFAENGTQVILKLAKTVDPPKADGGDGECFNSTFTKTEAEVGVNQKSGSVCVYLTRCFAARAITVDDYKKSYCFVNSYAGVCCPTSDVDRTA